ncbi:MAG: Gfo/Idh/MocA family protein [Devosia sp.]
MIKAALPLFMEKPVADTIKSAQALVAAGKAANIPIQVGHHRRHAPDIQRAKATIAEGRLGRILAVNGMWMAKKPRDYFDVAWRREAGGGPMLINLIHDIDLLRYLCGDIESVQAMSANSARGFAVEDTVVVLMRFASGALGTFTLSDAVPSPYGWDTAACQALYLAHQPGDCFFIGGEKATLSVPSMDLWRHEGDGDWRHPLTRTHLAHDHASCYVRQLDNFLAVVRGEAKPLVDGADGMMALATVAAIEEAARTGARVAPAQMLARG